RGSASELASNSTRWKKTLGSGATCCSTCTRLRPSVSTNSATACTSPGWSGQDSRRTTRTGVRSWQSVRPVAHRPDPGSDQQRDQQRRTSDGRSALRRFHPGLHVLLGDIGEPLRVRALGQLVDGGRERRTSLLDLSLDLLW